MNLVNSLLSAVQSNIQLHGGLQDEENLGLGEKGASIAGKMVCARFENHKDHIGRMSQCCFNLVYLFSLKTARLTSGSRTQDLEDLDSIPRIVYPKTDQNQVS